MPEVLTEGVTIDGGLPPADVLTLLHKMAVAKDGVTASASLLQLANLINAQLLGAAPAQLDTIEELAAALNNDANLAATLTAAIALKADATALALKADASSAPPGLLYGMAISNNTTDATNDIDVAAGECASDASTYRRMALASAMTKRTDAAWAVGSGNGGWLDGASMPNGTGHVFVISRSDTGAVDVALSASLSPTLPTNYDRKRRIGSIVRASGAIRSFVQDGDFFQFKAPSTDASAISTTATLRTLSLPLGIRLMARIGFQVAGTGPQPTLHHWDPAVAATLPSSRTGVTQVFVDTVVSQGVSGVLDVMTNTSGQIYNALASGSATTYALQTLGYFDTRGRFS
ncbi:hypothetical protein WDZ92_01050 [Nostoc sp. NIES-2111]